MKLHAVRQLIHTIDKTHRGLGAMLAINLVCSKAKITCLNIAPAECGKSTVTDSLTNILGEQAHKYTSLTLAGLKNMVDELNGYAGHITVDDLGGEKSEWSRISTITVLANLVYGHFVKKITQGYTLEISNFYGSASLNIQPILMQSLVGDNDWIAVIRGKVLRYYHLLRPTHPRILQTVPKLEYGLPLQEVRQPEHKGKLWYQLVAIALTQWGYGRINEFLPRMLKSMAALDNRSHTTQEDYRLLIKLMKPMQLERYLITSYSYESGRAFDNNTYCTLVELASHGNPSIETICEDYKISPETVIRLLQASPDWVFIERNSPKRARPTEQASKILRLAGVNQKW